MIELAELEIALRCRLEYARLADTHTQRSTLEDSWGIVKGREQILAQWVAQGRQEVAIRADLSDMIAFTVSQGERHWPGHRWVTREHGRILREIVIEDRGDARQAAAGHSPLGELRAGMGQLPAGGTAILPAGFPEAARPLANRLHAAWNGRAFDLDTADWLNSIVTALPDATFYFERAMVAEDRIALLWRVFGHLNSGRRIRLIGSGLFTATPAGEFHCDEMMLDQAAFTAQMTMPMIDYAAPSEGGA